MTINVIQNNFGAAEIALKCHNSSEMIVLSGVFDVDVDSEDYKAAQVLRMVFDASFEIAESRVSSAYLLSGYDGDCFGTTVKARIVSGNALEIEKLTLFDSRGSVRIVLCSMFVSGESAELIEAVDSVGLTFYSKDYSGTLVQDLGAAMNHFEENWGCVSGLFSNFVFSRGRDVEFTVNGLPEDCEFEAPLFYHRYYSGSAIGTKCFLMKFSGGKMTFRSDDGDGQAYNGNAFCSAYFVRD